jgi:iron(III) transport system substrate-binding protein
MREQMIARAQQEKEVVVADNQADQFQSALKGFHSRYPFITIKGYKASTSTIVNRVITEGKAGRPSIDLVGVSNDAMDLVAKAGVLGKQEAMPHLQDFFPGHQPEHGLYYNVLVTFTVQGIYNMELVPRREVPKSWDEMAEPKWTGKALMARETEEAPARVAWLLRNKNGELNWERSFNLFKKLAEQKPIIVANHREGVQRVAAGEAAVFWFGSMVPAAVTFSKGGPLGLVAFPKMQGRYRGYGVLKGARHPAAAWLMMDHLASPEGQFEYTEDIGPTPLLNKKAKPGKMARWLMEYGIRVEDVEFPKAEVFSDEVVKKSQTFYLQLLGIR